MSNKPHFVRNVPKFLQPYEAMLTKKKDFKRRETDEEDRIDRRNSRRGFSSVEDAIADGATVCYEDAPVESNIEIKEEKNFRMKEAEGTVTETNTEVCATRAEKEEEAQDNKEYFKDGKVIFHKKVTHKRKKENTGAEDPEAGKSTNVSKGKIPLKKKQKQRKELLSFDDPDEL